MINYKNIIYSNYTPITPYHILIEIDPTKIYTQLDGFAISKFGDDSDTNQNKVIQHLKSNDFEIHPIYYYPSKDSEKKSYCDYVYDTTDIVIYNQNQLDKITEIECSGKITYLAINKKKLICFRISSYTLSGVFYATEENLKFIDNLYENFKYKENEHKTSYKIAIAYNFAGSLSIRYKSIPIQSSIANLDFDKNYNDDFDYKKVYNLIEKEGKGLIIFHGPPGTGKTTFIKHLMYKYEDKRNFIYLPSSLAQSIDNPALTKFFLDNGENSVFIIEDAESLIASRTSGNTGLSGLLNASDGILSDLLNSKFIITFNSDINSNSVDNALLRKGRLNYIYRFGPLTKEKCSKFLNRQVNKEYVLTDLYNWDECNNNEVINQPSKIGF